MERIDLYPTHDYRGYKIRRGRPQPAGATIVHGGINFSVYSSHATMITLVLFEKGARRPFVEIPFPDEFRIGNVYTMMVFDIDYERIEYGYRADGAWKPEAGLRFDPTKILLDPHAKSIGGRDEWQGEVDLKNAYQHRARIQVNDFDWENDHPLEIPIEDLTIYEMHVRGFTQHDSSGVKHPGTYAGIHEKIPYLKDLGVNCVELMPIFEFDEYEHARPNPLNPDELLLNYWGYSTIGFFAPKAGYAATGTLGMEGDELKNLIKELHRNGIEVILDVVYNHTGEGNEQGETISYRGLDNSVYYLLAPDGGYYNFSGTGNTLNCNHPVVRDMVLNSLRYWVSEYHI
ncbi:MAG: alpha-amylase family glycosyl hydrolase, partial [Aggregatilineales bacterium]